MPGKPPSIEHELKELRDRLDAVLRRIASDASIPPRIQSGTFRRFEGSPPAESWGEEHRSEYEEGFSAGRRAPLDSWPIRPPEDAWDWGFHDGFWKIARLFRNADEAATYGR